MKTTVNLLLESQEQLEHLAMIIRRCPVGICLIDRRHVVQFANPAWAKMHGYISVGQFLGQPMEIFHTNDQMKREVYPFLEMVELIGRYDKRLNRRRMNQRLISADTTGFLVLDEEGAVIGYILYASNAEPQNQPDTKVNSSCQNRETMHLEPQTPSRTTPSREQHSGRTP